MLAELHILHQPDRQAFSKLPSGVRVLAISRIKMKMVSESTCGARSPEVCRSQHVQIEFRGIKCISPSVWEVFFI